MKGIIGLYTCSCHLFSSYEAAETAKKQKLAIGTPVKNRCTKTIGKVIELCEQKGYVIVKYGPLPKDNHLEHVQELIKIKPH
ncbi:hypothetical protein [Lutibacter maritimus]|uniref:Uncharacterized protein n=1 Tax=Lutibacter maritimus TaxID=593133 RepID=A0A1I6NRQ4_9FLAO|nr:hypothetical protein [Lutibacter maritimus]SFS30589.1 hypothetical protein SAMN04488006_0456 [Lutibacter maritimus]